MTQDDKIRYVDIGLRLLNIELHKELLIKVVKVIDIVDKKKGKTNIMDFIKIQSNK